jgi:hypothetical protein
VSDIARASIGDCGEVEQIRGEVAWNGLDMRGKHLESRGMAGCMVLNSALLWLCYNWSSLVASASLLTSSVIPYTAVSSSYIY